MKNYVQKGVAAVVATTLICSVASQASALSVEMVYRDIGSAPGDPSTVVTIGDNSALDTDLSIGSIVFGGDFGGYSLFARFSSGQGLGGAFLNSHVGVEALVDDASGIFFQAWETDFVFTPPGVPAGSPIGLPARTTIVGGAGASSNDLPGVAPVSVITNVDTTNTGREDVLVRPEQVIAFENYGTPTPALFSDVLNRNISHLSGSPFSLRTGLEFNTAFAGETSFAQVNNAVIPLPAPLALLASGLAVLGFASRLGRARRA